MNDIYALAFLIILFVLSLGIVLGLERLKEIILNSELNSASSLLDLIETSVLKFSDGLSQSDDVTLVAVYRQ